MKTLKTIQVILVMSVLANWLSILFFSNYYDYGFESPSISSLIRISQSLPFISEPGAIPVAISGFSPFFYWLLAPIIHLLHLSKMESIALYGRICVTGILLAYCWLINRFYRKTFPSNYSKTGLILCLAWFAISFSGIVHSVRPDFLSFLFEFLGLTIMSKWLLEKPPGKREVWIAGVFFGLAMAIKQNTIGFFLGSILFLILEKKGWETLKLILSALSIVCVLFGLAYFQDKSTLSYSLVELRNSIYPFVNLAEVFSNLLRDLFKGQLVFLFLGLIGFYKIYLKNKRLGMLFTCSFSSSAIIATLEQAKLGGSHNYYFGFFMAFTVFAAIGILEIIHLKGNNAFKFGFSSICIGVIVVQLYGLSISIGNIFFNERRNYPWDKVSHLLENKYPNAIVYSNDPSAILHVYDRTLLKPLSENLLKAASGLHNDLAQIKEGLRQHPFTLAILSGKTCESWKPSGIFKDETHPLTQLKHKLGKICIFGEEKDS